MVKENDYQSSLYILETYLTNEYSLDYFKKIYVKYPVSQILNDYSYILTNFGTCTLEELKEHKNRMRRYYMEKPFHYIYQLGLQLQSLLRKDLNPKEKISNSQITSLKILRACYVYDGNLFHVAIVLHLPISTLITYLSSPFLLEVLSPESIAFLNQILVDSYLFETVQTYDRKQTLSSLFDIFYQCNGNLEAVKKSTNLSISTLKALLGNSQNIFLTGHMNDQEWITSVLNGQEDYKEIVENQILLDRKNVSEISKQNGIQEEKIRKLVKEQLPYQNPVRGVLVNGVLSTLDS